MKVIFLDVDDVLNCKTSKSRCNGYIGIDGDKVSRLKTIVDATGAEIVLSSTWRLGYNKDGHDLEHHWKYLKRKFSKCKLHIRDVTPELSRNGELRGHEIKEWLDNHPDVTNWVVLDDEYFLDFVTCDIVKHWIETSFYEENGGLQDKHVKQIIKVLNNE